MTGMSREAPLDAALAAGAYEAAALRLLLGLLRVLEDSLDGSSGARSVRDELLALLGGELGEPR